MKRYLHLLLTFILLTICNMQMHSQAQSSKYDDYIDKYKAIAVKQQKEYKIPASITLAQGLLESSAGESSLAKNGNNHFGIKCKDNWTGGRIYHDDDAPKECFRKYRDAEDSYTDHALFLTKRKYYVSLFALDVHDYKGWARGLQKCGYATDKNYGKKLIDLIETYELYKYDYETIDQINRNELADEIYEIKIDTKESKKGNPSSPIWRRKIYEANGIHYIIAQENDTYDIIAYDVQSRVSKIYKYNETTKEHALKKGDIIYLQKKRKYADKKYKAHIVKEGESMHSISQLYGMRIKYLYKLNKLKDSYIPQPGDFLRVNKK